MVVEQRTVKNLWVYKIDPTRNLIWVKGRVCLLSLPVFHLKCTYSFKLKSSDIFLVWNPCSLLTMLVCPPILISNNLFWSISQLAHSQFLILCPFVTLATFPDSRCYRKFFVHKRCSVQEARHITASISNLFCTRRWRLNKIRTIVRWSWWYRSLRGCRLTKV